MEFKTILVLNILTVCKVVKKCHQLRRSDMKIMIFMAPRGFPDLVNHRDCGSFIAGLPAGSNLVILTLEVVEMIK